jgi:hypothetical protein
VTNGGRLIACSDQHYGTPLNIAFPGQGANMGEGWETHRRGRAGRRIGAESRATNGRSLPSDNQAGLCASKSIPRTSRATRPLWFIRGSHRPGPAPTGLDTVTTSYALWTVPNDAVARLANDGGILSAHGPAGTGLIFGDLMVHGSPANMSPWDRRIFSLILNPVANRQTAFKRPDYQHHRDVSPVEPLADDCLLPEQRAVV